MNKNTGSRSGRKGMRSQANYSVNRAMNVQSIKAPSIALLALEARASLEFGAGLALWPILQRAPKGDGHPVLIFPGLGAGNLSTLLMRQFLKNRGYAVHPWRYNLNLGPRPGVIRGCIKQLEDLYHMFDQKVSLIGWSLGGFYAREIAKIMPDMVRSVITLGTPFAGPPKANHAWFFYEFITGLKVNEPAFETILSEPPPVPTTSIYSRTDGIVAWQCCVQDESHLAENIEVQASHIGMGANPFTLFVIADRLSQPEDDWKPYL
jgi:pimeloyl-ACP methyl ester carboxylesterase